jgi:hypothetical protein
VPLATSDQQQRSPILYCEFRRAQLVEIDTEMAQELTAEAESMPFGEARNTK